MSVNLLAHVREAGIGEVPFFHYGAGQGSRAMELPYGAASPSVFHRSC